MNLFNIAIILSVYYLQELTDKFPFIDIGLRQNWLELHINKL